MGTTKPTPRLLEMVTGASTKGSCDPIINFQERYRAHLDLRDITLSAATLQSSFGHLINMLAGTEDGGRWSGCFLVRAVPRMFQFLSPG